MKLIRAERTSAGRVGLLVSATLFLAFSACSSGYDIPSPDAAALLAAGYDSGCNSGAPSQGDLCTEDCDLGAKSCNASKGRRFCTCEGGVYVQCQCLPPDNWPFKDVPAAPYCDSISGEPRYLALVACDHAGAGTMCRGRKDPTMGAICEAKSATAKPVWNPGVADTLGIPANAPACEDFGTGLVYDIKPSGPQDKPCDTDWELCIARDVNPTGTSPRGCICWPEGTVRTWECVATQRWFRAE